MARKQDRISAEALDAYLAGNQYNSETVSKFLHEAVENGAEIYEVYPSHDSNLNIIARVPELTEGTSIGVYFALYLHINKVCAWVAVEDERSFRDGFSLLINESLTESYKVLLDKAIDEACKCDFCRERVQRSTLRRVGFCNKACPKCYDKAKAKLEYKGWCD